MHSEIDFNNKTIIITGGAGFIGSNLAFYFQKKFPYSKIIIFDCFRNGDTFDNGNLKSFGHFKNILGFKGNVICGNINNQVDLDLLADFNIDYIFHHAAISDTRVYDQEMVLRTNVNSFYKLLEISKQNNSTLIYASSGATYGSLPPPQIVGKESPENPYGYSKFIMDQIAERFSKENPQLPIIGLRFFNVYGPKEHFKASTSSMITQLGHQILSGKRPRLFFDSNKIFRDFIYIDDVIQANLKACSCSKNGVYNIATAIPRSFQDVSDILQEELGTNFDNEYFINPYEDYQMNTQADISATKMHLGFNPIFSLEKGIKKYIPELIRVHESEKQ
jgi:ADP-L-glycero-D-manno-heptose 6-epimerase